MENESEELVAVKGEKNRKRKMVHSVHEINNVAKFTSDGDPEMSRKPFINC